MPVFIFILDFFVQRILCIIFMYLNLLFQILYRYTHVMKSLQYEIKGEWSAWENELNGSFWMNLDLPTYLRSVECEILTN